jgi:hypothetical protein
MALLLTVAGSALMYWTLESFTAVDWGQGLARTVFLAWLIVAAVALIHTAPGRTWKWTPQPRWIAALLALGVACLCMSTVWQSITKFQEARHGRQIDFDQGKFSYRAARMLAKGMNPYARDVVLDTTEYPMAMRDLQRDSCYESGPPVDQANSIAEGFGRDFNPHRWNGLIPKIANRSGCTMARFRSESFGLKYGPPLVAIYLPFVLLWDQAGIFATHLFFMGLACFFIWRLGWRVGHHSMLFSLIPLIAFLLPSHLRHNTLSNPATDLIPMTLVIAAWTLIEEEREVSGAMLLALAFTAKLAPGLFYLPLLLRCRRRSRIAFTATLALVLGPFLIWDGRGLLINLFLFNFLRNTDSTALIHGMSPFTTKAVQCICMLTALVALIYAHRRRYDFAGFLTFLLVVHGTALASGKIFHNNYLLWILYLLGLAILVGLDPRGTQNRNAT